MKKIALLLTTSLLTFFLLNSFYAFAEIRPEGGLGIIDSSLNPSMKYEAKPGSKIEDSVTVANYGAEDKVINISLKPSEKNSTYSSNGDLTSWTSIPQKVYIAPAGKYVQIPFTIIVPDSAEKGKTSSLILSAISNPEKTKDTDKPGLKIGISTEASTRIHLLVTADPAPVKNLTVTEPKNVLGNLSLPLIALLLLTIICGIYFFLLRKK